MLKYLPWLTKQGRKDIKQRRERLKELTFKISQADAQILGDSFEKEDGIYEQRLPFFFSVTDSWQNEQKWLKQRRLTMMARDLGVAMPDDYWEKLQVHRYQNLNSRGEELLRKEVRKELIALLKDCVAILAPLIGVTISIISLALAATSLYISLHKHT